MNASEILKRLEEIEARAEKATPGPWKVINRGLDGYIVGGQGEYIFGGEANEGYISCKNPNAIFVVHTREDVPWLHSLARQLMAECMEMRWFVETVAEEEDNPSLTFPEVISMAQRLLWRLARGADVGAGLLAYLRKLEAVAREAQAVVKNLIPSADWPELNRLKQALAALEEEK